MANGNAEVAEASSCLEKELLSFRPCPSLKGRSKDQKLLLGFQEQP